MFLVTLPPEVWAGLIGAIVTLLAALIPIINSIKWLKEKSRFLPIDKKTKESMRGYWIGYTKVEGDVHDRLYEASVNFAPDGREVKRTMHIKVRKENEKEDPLGWTLDFVGGL